MRDALAAMAGETDGDATPLDREETLEMLALSEVVIRKAGYGRQAMVRSARAAPAPPGPRSARRWAARKQAAWEAHHRWIEEQAGSTRAPATKDSTRCPPPTPATWPATRTERTRPIPASWATARAGGVWGCAAAASRVARERLLRLRAQVASQAAREWLLRLRARAVSQAARASGFSGCARERFLRLRARAVSQAARAGGLLLPAGQPPVAAGRSVALYCDQEPG